MSKKEEKRIRYEILQAAKKQSRLARSDKEWATLQSVIDKMQNLLEKNQ